MVAENRKRIYEAIIREHFAENRQMVFLSGPRQSGKTTLAKSLASDYLNWDDSEVRKAIAAGQNETGSHFCHAVVAQSRRVCYTIAVMPNGVMSMV